LGVDELGLFPSDRNILYVLREKFDGGPVGLTTLAAASSEDPATIEEVYEPYLMQVGLLERTPRGRMITNSGSRHIGDSAQDTLL